MKKPIKKVADNLFRSSRPDSVEDLIQNGINVVICLQSGMYEFWTQDKYEDHWKLFEGRGIQRIDISCSDFTPPSPFQVRLVMDIIRICAGEGKKVLIHCLSGVDRTGYMAAAYRLLKGWEYKKARREYIEEGQHFWYRWWIPFLRRYEN